MNEWDKALKASLHAVFKPSPFHPHPFQGVLCKLDREKEREEEDSFLAEVSGGCIEVTVAQGKGG